MLHITTNNVPRELIDGFQLNAKEREDFDYLDWAAIDEGTESASFFRYKGELYSLDTFMRTNDCVRSDETQSEMNKWSGYMSESHSSGMLVRFDGDGSIVVARYYEGA